MIVLFSFLIFGFSVIVHELAHGVTALRFGDPTAKRMGRLSFNPLVHIDVVGSLLLPGLLLLSNASFLIGWAKPVPVDPAYFRRPLRDMMWVAFAGPLSNITLAACFGLLAKLTPPAMTFGFFLPSIFEKALYLNLFLAFFNLFPIPPLDGSKIVMPFLPFHWQQRLFRLEPYGFALIFLLSYLGFFGFVLGYVVPLVARLFL